MHGIACETLVLICCEYFDPRQPAHKVVHLPDFSYGFSKIKVKVYNSAKSR